MITPNRRDAVDWAYQNFRSLFDQNLNRTCDQIVGIVLTKINDPEWGRVGKTRGEGQYRPPDWVDFQARGTDGVLYTISGWSHDAIFHRPTNQQVDLLGSGNDSGVPIFTDRGEQIRATPTWNLIPQTLNRPNNPWLAFPRHDLPPAPSVFPPYPQNEADVDGAGVALFEDFAASGQSPNPEMFRHAFRVCYDWLAKNEPNLKSSVLKHRLSWRGLLPRPPGGWKPL